MITLFFKGWFQCRLATDPDPHDERRGVSGYVHAYAGEPDLDRLIHWQPPPFSRAEAPAVGVTVQRVSVDGGDVANHGLIGARVSLLDNAKFEGRNGVIADDGKEPIYPFHLRVQTTTGILLQRQIVPYDPDYPFAELLALALQVGPDVARDVAAQTGISDLKAEWRRRVGVLQTLADAATGATKVGLGERIAVLSRWLAAPRSPSQFFGARMTYDYALRSLPVVTGWSATLGGTPAADDEWRVRFWLGGWDADTLCGFCDGVLEVPTTLAPQAPPVGSRDDDRDSLMRGDS